MTLQLPTSMARLLRSLKSAIVQEVPSSNAVCEFDCRHLNCSEQRWQNCTRRMAKQEVGE